MQQTVGVSGVEPAAEQDLVAAAQDEVDVDDLRVPAGLLDPHDRGVALVVYRAAPQRGVVGELLDLGVLGERPYHHGQFGGADAHGLRLPPAALDQHQASAAAQQPGPASQRRHRVGERPQQVPDEHHVEPALRDGRFGRVPEQDAGPGTGQLRAGQRGHPR